MKPKTYSKQYVVILLKYHCDVKEGHVWPHHYVNFFLIPHLSLTWQRQVCMRVCACLCQDKEGGVDKGILGKAQSRERDHPDIIKALADFWNPWALLPKETTIFYVNERRQDLCPIHRRWVREIKAYWDIQRTVQPMNESLCWLIVEWPTVLHTTGSSKNTFIKFIVHITEKKYVLMLAKSSNLRFTSSQLCKHLWSEVFFF